jgi:hypothetical protein
MYLNSVFTPSTCGVNIKIRELLEHLSYDIVRDRRTWLDEEYFTFPVLLALWVTFNSAGDSLGRTPGISPPVACLGTEN